MIGKRLEKLAYVLVNHSFELNKNDLFMISGSHAATQLIKEVYRQAIDVGAYPYVKWSGGIGRNILQKILRKTTQIFVSRCKI